jgi:hypothetical protein
LGTNLGVWNCGEVAERNCNRTADGMLDCFDANAMLKRQRNENRRRFSVRPQWCSGLSYIQKDFCQIAIGKSAGSCTVVVPLMLE